MLKRVENENDAEDICIQTFARAFDKLNSYDKQYTFGTWIITISKNLHIDLNRKKKLETSRHFSEAPKKILGVADEALGPEDQLIAAQKLFILRQKINQLKPTYREILQLRYFNDLSYKEIAHQLHLPLNNVKVRLLRAKKLLSEILEEPI